MQCPACGESLIVLKEHDQIEVDYCHACHGTWIDAGELDLILGGHQARTEFLSSGRPATNVTEAGRKCPVCKKIMEKALTAAPSLFCTTGARATGCRSMRASPQSVLAEEEHHIAEGRREVLDFLREVFPA